MKTTPLHKLQDLGQSVWLDDIHRRLLRSGELKGLIRSDGLSGVTSNPAIFEEALRDRDDYAPDIERFARAGKTPTEIYQRLVLSDIRDACDQLHPIYERFAGGDGYVSVEVSPRLADDTAATVREGLELWSAVDRPNVMIKVPGTPAGLPAISQLLIAGVNVNVTLLFSLARYRQVMDNYIAALEERLRRGQAIGRIASVASFFLSRIDSAVDPLLRSNDQDPELDMLVGHTAIALARIAYQDFRRALASPRWQVLARQGAQPQRLLWASTSSKDPSFSDTKYLDALIGPQTVTTVPRKTLAAFRDHGQAQARLETELEYAQALPLQLAERGIDLERVAEQLEREGIAKFIAPYQASLDILAECCQAAAAEASH